MASLRKFSAYRMLGRAYTRKSKFKKKGYIKAVPNHKIVRFDLGNKQKKDWKYTVKLVSKDTVQVRHNALEATRQLLNRHLQAKLGLANYYLKVNLYPHQALRENKLLTGAGADRMQTGMKHAFGKVISCAAIVKRGRAMFTVKVDEAGKDMAEKILRRAAPRLPCHIGIVVEKKK